MATSITICNRALSHIGNKANVAAIDPPDGSVEANWCSQFYAEAVKRTLEREDWTFARKRATLALLATNPSTVWAYAYTVPSDCIAARRVLTDNPTQYEDDSAPYQLEGDTLFTNKQDAVLVYTFLQNNASKFSAGFANAISYDLASDLAGPILKGNEGANAAIKLLQTAALVARQAAAQDSERADRPDNQYAPGSISARGGYDSRYNTNRY